jgi:hypothetical protein
MESLSARPFSEPWEHSDGQKRPVPSFIWGQSDEYVIAYYKGQVAEDK